MISTRLTIIAVIGAFALGTLGANALGDDGPSFGDLDAIQLAAGREDDDQRDDEGKGDDGHLDGKRDEDDIDVDPRDDDDDDVDTGRDRRPGHGQPRCGLRRPP